MKFLENLDHQVFFLFNALANTAVGDIFAGLTWWGDGVLCVPIMFLLAWHYRAGVSRDQLRSIVVFSVALGFLIVLLKSGFGRARPGALLSAFENCGM